jgi:hypothetical protein
VETLIDVRNIQNWGQAVTRRASLRTSAIGSFADSWLWPFVDPKTAFPQPAQNKPENESYPYVRFPPNCRRSEDGHGRLKAAAAAITGFVSV